MTGECSTFFGFFVFVFCFCFFKFTHFLEVNFSLQLELARLTFESASRGPLSQATGRCETARGEQVSGILINYKPGC